MIQRSVLDTVIDLHPIQVTVSELVCQIASPSEDFGEREAIKMAVSDLAAIGLLNRHALLNRPDSLVAPTRAALHVYALLEED